MPRYLIAFGIAGVATLIALGCGSDGASSIPKDTNSDDAGASGDTGTSNDAGTGKPPVSEVFAIGGTVKGLAGTGLVLQNNAGDDLTVNANGTFVFSKKLAKGASFAVTVKNPPTAPSQTCTVTGGTGTVASGNVTTIVVECASDKFTVGGTVSGLAGTGLVLQNKGGDDITVGANGAFAFTTPLIEGDAYEVTVKTQPTNLAQTCTVTGGSGTVATANVTSVEVSCTTNKYTVGGTVSGLVGTGLVLQNNGGDDVPLNANGTFQFATSQDDGTNFAVTVLTDPTNPAQTCTVTGGSGTLAGGNVASVAVNCSTKTFTVGGTVSGLAGTGLVLQNNGGDDVPLNANGTFAFPTAIEDLAAYAVTVKTQPTNKWQTCTVTNANGNVASANVTNIAVVCTTNTYKVKGMVSGLAGTGLVLQNNAGGDLPIAADGPFEFTNAVASGAGYLVSVLTNPVNKSQTCTVTGGSGNVAGADVTNVVVTCVTNQYEVGGTVSGLVGSGLVLQNNAGDDLPIATDGTFAFGTKIESGQPYAVTVKTQPSTPNQQCVVTGGTGNVAAGNVVSVAVNCTTNKYTVGGKIVGLDGTGLVLQNNAGDDLPINGNGGFAFATPQLDGTAYAVTVKTQPTGKSQTCSVTSGSGNLAGGDVTGVTVTCVTNKYSVGGTITGLIANGLVLTNNGGDDNAPANGATTFTFATSVESGGAYAVAVKATPVGLACAITNGSGTVVSSNVTNVQIVCGSVGSSTFNVTKTIENFVVPSWVTTLTIAAGGAQGGSATTAGGRGARMSGRFTVTPGEVLRVAVGEMPASGNGGGGGSFVFRQSNGAALIVAGGGGGGAGECCGGQVPGYDAVTTIDGVSGGNGGCGGPTAGTAGNGGAGGTGQTNGSGGGAGFLSKGGDGDSVAKGGLSIAGGLLGGAGMTGKTNITPNGGFGGGGGAGNNGYWNLGSGGGGGGYSGGGGVCNTSNWGSGGGGGSFNGGTNQVNSVGQTGNGVVTITW